MMKIPLGKMSWRGVCSKNKAVDNVLLYIARNCVNVLGLQMRGAPSGKQSRDVAQKVETGVSFWSSLGRGLQILSTVESSSMSLEGVI